MVVELSGVEVRYAERVALSGLDLRVEPGERIAVIGPSGAGKSTLIRLLNGTVDASRGRVSVLGTELAAASARALRATRRRIGTIHQQFDLVGELRVVHNVNAGRLGDWGLLRSTTSLVWPREIGVARAALDRVGLADRIAQRTSTLSGGEQQRVAIARVLVQRPALIL
ncbi:MAG: ATP-binding cassette domain-containing protein, partial [Actinomycetia bacterium]|nr:ATP-binding cassette domain-containing protein [Actinomycetes bacterium]